MPESTQIRDLLAKRGETLDAFAVRAGIARRTLQNVFNGRPTHRSTRRLISGALGLQEDQVFSADGIYYYSNAPFPDEVTQQ